MLQSNVVVCSLRDHLVELQFQFVILGGSSYYIRIEDPLRSLRFSSMKAVIVGKKYVGTDSVSSFF